MKANPDAFRRAAAQVPSCTIDQQSLERQEERHRRLATSVVQMRHQGNLLLVDFAPDFDSRALDELIAVERECCPFFAFSFDEQSRHLEVGVHDPEAAEALGAIVQALSAKPAEALLNTSDRSLAAGREAPLAVEAGAPSPGLFPYDKFSSADFLRCESYGCEKQTIPWNR